MTSGKIFSAIPAIISEVGPVGKNSVNQQQKYKYRSADDICDALHDSLGRHRVFTTCDIAERQVSERESKNGGVLFYVNLKARYTFHAEDGSNVSTDAWGEAMDSGDKATNKAMTAAYKYALLQVFCLMGHDDSEFDSPEPARQTPHQSPQQRTQDLAKQHGMKTGADVGPSKEQVDALEKYRTWFASAWTDEAYSKVVDKLKEEKSQWLLSQLKIVWDEAQRRVQLLAAESIDGDTFDQVLLWVDKTPVLRDLEKFLDTAIYANPSPFNEEQKERLYSAFEKRQQRKG